MAQDRCVYIRRESLRRFIWEKYENHTGTRMKIRWRVHWPVTTSAPSRSIAGTMTDHELNTVLLHEIGEIKAGQLLAKNGSRCWLACRAHRLNSWHVPCATTLPMHSPPCPNSSNPLTPHKYILFCQPRQPAQTDFSQPDDATGNGTITMMYRRCAN